jgi:hypothetical protein
VDTKLALTVVMVGPNMSGKTVALAVLQSKAWLPTANRRWYLDSTFSSAAYDGSLSLNQIFTEIIDPNRPMPRRTEPGELFEYAFRCRLEGAAEAFSPVQIRFGDIPGEDITQPAQSGQAPRDSLLGYIHDADAIIGMLDGQDIHDFISGKMNASELHNRYFGTFANLRRSRERQPVHLVLTKWDLFIDPKAPRQFDLGYVRSKLLEVGLFKTFVESRHRARIPMHLIPVSSLGAGFLDETSHKTGKADVSPRNIDIPLAYVLCDALASIEADKQGSVSSRVKEILSIAGYLIEPATPGPVGSIIRLLRLVLLRERHKRVSELDKFNQDLNRRLRVIKSMEDALDVMVSELALQKVKFEYDEPDTVLASGDPHEG